MQKGSERPSSSIYTLAGSIGEEPALRRVCHSIAHTAATTSHGRRWLAARSSAVWKASSCSGVQSCPASAGHALGCSDVSSIPTAGDGYLSLRAACWSASSVHLGTATAQCSMSRSAWWGRLALVGREGSRARALVLRRTTLLSSGPSRGAHATGMAACRQGIAHHLDVSGHFMPFGCECCAVTPDTVSWAKEHLRTGRG